MDFIGGKTEVFTFCLARILKIGRMDRMGVLIVPVF
jgi:hypothetical protein